jgi:hypothetical protein
MSISAFDSRPILGGGAGFVKPTAVTTLIRNYARRLHGIIRNLPFRGATANPPDVGRSIHGRA